MGSILGRDPSSIQDSWKTGSFHVILLTNQPTNQPTNAGTRLKTDTTSLVEGTLIIEQNNCIECILFQHYNIRTSRCHHVLRFAVPEVAVRLLFTAWNHVTHACITTPTSSHEWIRV